MSKNNELIISKKMNQHSKWQCEGVGFSTKGEQDGKNDYDGG
jgi:hypothetical protein